MSLYRKVDVFENTKVTRYNNKTHLSNNNNNKYHRLKNIRFKEHVWTFKFKTSSLKCTCQLLIIYQMNFA